MDQEVRFSTAAGRRIAYAVVGDGPVLLLPAWWVSHIELTWLFMFNWAQGRPELTLEQERTVALTTLVIFQAFHLFSSRSELRSVFQMSPLSNRFLVFAQAGALAVHVAALYLGFTQFVLRVEPIPPEAWMWIVLVSASVLVVVEIDKLIRRRPGTTFARQGRTRTPGA